MWHPQRCEVPGSSHRPTDAMEPEAREEGDNGDRKPINLWV